MPKACRSWLGKAPKKGTLKQQEARKINWALFVVGGALGTLRSVFSGCPPMATGALRAAIHNLEDVQAVLRTVNLQRSKVNETLQ